MNGEEFEEELYRENLYFVYEDKCKELEKELENLKKIEKEHQRINGELREENKRLQEEATYMTKKAYDFYSALLDIKELVVNNACLDEGINKCVDDLIYYKCDELLDIVNKALGSDKE